MNKSLTISRGEWGYVTRLSDWSGGKAGKAGETPDGRHKLKAFGEYLMPGVPDQTILPHTGFGYVRPLDLVGGTPEERALNAKWMATMRVAHLDYYVARLHGSPDPDAVGLYYPERLFVTGRNDDDGYDLERSEVLRHLAAVGITSHPEYWHPVQLFTGMNMGFPVFHQGLRADTDYGPSWYGTVTSKLLGRKLPDGYTWDHYPSAKYGTLYIETE